MSPTCRRSTNPSHSFEIYHCHRFPTIFLVLYFTSSQSPTFHSYLPSFSCQLSIALSCPCPLGYEVDVALKLAVARSHARAEEVRPNGWNPIPTIYYGYLWSVPCVRVTCPDCSPPSPCIYFLLYCCLFVEVEEGLDGGYKITTLSLTLLLSSLLLFLTGACTQIRIINHQPYHFNT